jgi:thiol-disulfide isomerase/thioredoxin
MSLTPSNMLAIGTVSPDFCLLDTVSGNQLELNSIVKGQPFLVVFICNHCPFVIHLHKGLQELVKTYGDQIQFVAINSNDTNHYPEDAPELMTALFTELGFDFPYLFDESQEVAKAYDAACTPDFYLFSKNKKLFYRGQFDDSRPGNGVEVTGSSLRAGIDDLLNGKSINANQNPSVGCNIKWKR